MSLERARAMLATNRVTDAAGVSHALHSAISEAEGEMLHSLIRRHETIARGVEIGCAFGVSSLYICDALSQRPSPRHVIIDPCQASAPWHNIGVQNLTRAGFRFFELREEPSELALPELLRRGDVFDFAFIDGWHTFDHVMLDFFYIDRLLSIGGIVVFDDVDYPAVRSALRYISRYPSYEIAESVTTSGARAAGRGCLEANDVSMVALRKIDDDKRNWDWHVPF